MQTLGIPLDLEATANRLLPHLLRHLGLD